MSDISTIASANLQTFNKISLITFSAFSLWLWSAILGAFYATIANEKDLLESERTYNSKMYFIGNDFRNQFGEWYGITLFIHVITAMIMAVLILLCALNVYFPKRFGGTGTKYHRTLGVVYIITWMIHMIDGMIPAFALTVNRGLSPCQYITDGQIREHSPHSFSVIFFVHVLYWIFKINETISYGLCSFVLKDKITETAWIKYTLLFLSASSVALVAARIVILLAFFVYFQTFPLPCVAKVPLMFWIFVYFIEVPTVLASISNIKYIIYPDIEEFESWKHHHSYNMKLSVFTTFRTFVASMVYKIDPITTSIWYFVTAILYVIKIFNDRKKREAARCEIKSSEKIEINEQQIEETYTDVEA